MDTYNQSTEISGELIKFKTSCPDHMKNYIRFLNDHHRYPFVKLLDLFPEYLIKNQQK